MNQTVSLSDMYTQKSGHVYMSGTQALVRLPMVQMWRDQAAGLNTGAYISGYRGSPLGGYDMQLSRAKKYLAPLDIHFQPGVNEEIAATAVWGTQSLALSPQARKDGVVGIWYGKGPGVDRSGDVFKHANASGTSPHGGVLALAGDDHACKSSTIPHQSDHAFAAAQIPLVYPSSVHEFVELGLFSIAMSRFSGSWAGMKCISDTLETTATVDLSAETRQFVTPEGFVPPPGGLNWRWPDPPMPQDERLLEHKSRAVLEFARANAVDMEVFRANKPRLGIMASGKAFEDVSEALGLLEIGAEEIEAFGLALYKVRMPWPLEGYGVRRFAKDLDEILVVEERREIIENQIKQELYSIEGKRPRISGKSTPEGTPLFPISSPMTALSIAVTLAGRLLGLEGGDPSLLNRLKERREELEMQMARAAKAAAPIARTPYFCSGCPHNTSTKVPEGSRATAGIGCHYLVTLMDRRTEGFTQMGGEGGTWLSQALFTDEKHHFVNLGDGTYFHSGYLTIRAAVAAKVNITYKILYNDAVAMTGGQTHDGELSPERMVRQLSAEGVKPVYLLSETPEAYDSGLLEGTIVLHRDRLDDVQKILRETEGCSAIVFVQTCAAEKRRRRKKGTLEDPAKVVFIDPDVCEGCGDCSVQANCVSIEPLETEMGRKRQINQSSCNKDFSCVKGFCPSFVTVKGGKLRKSAAAAEADIGSLLPPPPVDLSKGPVNVLVAGVGGTGVLTVGAILGMAARLDGNASMMLDIAGLAQKGGAVMSHVRIGERTTDVLAPRIAAGRAHVLIAADDVVAASPDNTVLYATDRTTAIVNTKLTPVGQFQENRDIDFKSAAVHNVIRKATNQEGSFLNFSDLALRITGDAIFSNMLMLGFTFQNGVLPVSGKSMEEAIRLNGVAVEANLRAFNWGRKIAAEPQSIDGLQDSEFATPAKPLDEMTFEEVVAHRENHLKDYQNRRLAKRYRQLVEQVANLEGEAMARMVAISYAKVLAYKDEYEVARLLTKDGKSRQLESRFEGKVKVSYNFAPPFLNGGTKDGRPRKREFGAWITPVLHCLSAMRVLRGTVFDIAGYTEERREERQLISDYESWVKMVLEAESADTQTKMAILSLPEQVRGYGPVKSDAMKKARQDFARLAAELSVAKERIVA